MVFLANSSLPAWAVVDLYCERTGTEFNVNAEPLNVWTNVWAVVLGVGFVIFALRKTQDGRRRNDISLAGGVLYMTVGIGSFIWHMLGYNVLLFMDLLFPCFFGAWFIFHWLWRVLRLRRVWPRLLLCCIVLAALAGLFALGDYMPFYQYTSVHWLWYVGLYPLAVLHYCKARFRRWAGFVALGLTTCALLFYALDKAMEKEPSLECWASGAHFLWHIFSYTGFFFLLLMLPPEDDEEDLTACYSCLWPTAFSKREAREASSTKG